MAGFALVMIAARGFAQTLVSDKTDYAPGEVANLSGSGFDPGESVDLSISIDDPETALHVADYAWSIESADAEGAFVTTFVIPSEALGTVLTATAMGYASGKVAVTRFTDDVIESIILSPTAGNPVTVTSLPAEIPISLSGTFRVLGLGPVQVLAEAKIQQNGVDVANATIVSLHLPPLVYYGAFVTITSEMRAVLPPGTTSGTYDVIASLSFTVGGSVAQRTGTEVGAVVVDACTATNQAPTLSASDRSLGDICPPGGSIAVTVTPADFSPMASDPDGDPVTVTFDDGTTSRTITLTSTGPSATLALIATDDPSGRHSSGCPPIGPLSTTTTVILAAGVHLQPTNAPPTISATDYDPGPFCLDGGATSVVVPLSFANFDASASDPDGDSVALTLSEGSVTLVFPAESTSGDALVEASVTIRATDDPGPRDEPACPPLVPMTAEKTVKVTATLHRNRPPVLAAADLNLGQLVGCLVGGSIERIVALAPDDFSALASDPDGDAVSVTVSAGQVTLVGPGFASAPVTLTATDDPSARGSCSLAPLQSAPVTINVTARIGYDSGGFEPPLSSTVTRKVQRGSTVPVKFRIFDCTGAEICTSPGSVPPVIEVQYQTGASPEGDPEVTDAGSSNNDGSYFQYSGTCGVDGAWIYHLQTNSTYALNSTYLIRAVLSDGTRREALISTKP